MPTLGRPKETPLSLLERDLSQTLRLHKEVRELIQSQVSKLSEMLSLEMPVATRLEILEALTSMSESLTKSTQQSAKFVMTEDNKDEGLEGSGGSPSIEELLLGKDRRR